MGMFKQDLLDREEEVRVYIEKYADLFNLDPNLIRAVITQESAFTAEATSHTGAYGYGQFTGIGAKQVQNIARMTDKAADLIHFTKQNADEPDFGIKAICATFWWLMYKKYRRVADKKIQLEASLTFYNAGGRPAALVIKHGGHEHAVSAIKALPKNWQSQSVTYAPKVSASFVRWHEHMAVEIKEEPPSLLDSPDNPFDTTVDKIHPCHKALIESLLLMGKGKYGGTHAVDVTVGSRDNRTEVTLLFFGEMD